MRNAASAKPPQVSQSSAVRGRFCCDDVSSDLRFFFAASFAKAAALLAAILCFWSASITSERLDGEQAEGRAGEDRQDRAPQTPAAEEGHRLLRLRGAMRHAVLLWELS